MKQTADAMREVGHTISPSQLVLNLLRGINPCFANTADIIANTSPLPNFKAATNMLRVKELRLGNKGKEASALALAAFTTPSCTSPSCQSTASSAPNRGGGGKGKGVRVKVAAVATATTVEGAISRTSSSVVPNRAPPVGAKLLHRLALGSATLLGPASGHRSTSSSSGGRHQHLPHRLHLSIRLTAFAPPQYSAPPAYGSWDQTSLIATLNQLALPWANP